MNGFCAHLTKINHLAPEVVFDVTAHWLAEPKDRICIHLKCVQQRKQVGPRILEYLCHWTDALRYRIVPEKRDLHFL